MVTCAKCGTENAAGDAFCGGCGAYLEFVAEEAAEAAHEAPEAPEAEGRAQEAAPAPDAASTSAPAAAAADPAQPVPATPGPAKSPAGGPTCAVCGRSNPIGRTFCIACGEKLAGGRAAATPAGAESGPARAAAREDVPRPASTQPVPAAPTPAPKPAGPTRPAWDFPTAPVPAPAPAAPASATAPPSQPRSGRSRLVLIGGLVVVLVLVGGGAVLFLGGGLGGATPSPGSSTGSPGATAAANPSGEGTIEPATQAPGTESTAEPTGPAATIPPGPAIGITLTGAKASSRLSAKRAPTYVRDGSPATAWLSKSGAFDGSWIEVTFAPAAVTRIQIWAGWQRDDPTYQGYRRPRNVTVSFDGGDPVPLRLQDVLGAQRVDIPPQLGITAATRLRITIADTYPGRKTSASGTPARQVAISEIRIFGVPVTP